MIKKLSLTYFLLCLIFVFSSLRYHHLSAMDLVPQLTTLQERLHELKGEEKKNSGIIGLQSRLINVTTRLKILKVKLNRLKCKLGGETKEQGAIHDIVEKIGICLAEEKEPAKELKDIIQEASDKKIDPNQITAIIAQDPDPKTIKQLINHFQGIIGSSAIYHPSDGLKSYLKTLKDQLDTSSKEQEIKDTKVFINYINNDLSASELLDEEKRKEIAGRLTTLNYLPAQEFGKQLSEKILDHDRRENFITSITLISNDNTSLATFISTILKQFLDYVLASYISHNIALTYTEPGSKKPIEASVLFKLKKATDAKLDSTHITRQLKKIGWLKKEWFSKLFKEKNLGTKFPTLASLPTELLSENKPIETENEFLNFLRETKIDSLDEKTKDVYLRSLDFFSNTHRDDPQGFFNTLIAEKINAKDLLKLYDILISLEPALPTRDNTTIEEKYLNWFIGTFQYLIWPYLESSNPKFREDYIRQLSIYMKSLELKPITPEQKQLFFETVSQLEPVILPIDLPGALIKAGIKIGKDFINLKNILEAVKENILATNEADRSEKEKLIKWFIEQAIDCIEPSTIELKLIEEEAKIIRSQENFENFIIENTPTEEDFYRNLKKSSEYKAELKSYLIFFQEEKKISAENLAKETIKKIVEEDDSDLNQVLYSAVKEIVSEEKEPMDQDLKKYLISFTQWLEILLGALSSKVNAEEDYEYLQKLKELKDMSNEELKEHLRKRFLRAEYEYQKAEENLKNHSGGLFFINQFDEIKKEKQRSKDYQESPSLYRNDIQKALSNVPSELKAIKEYYESQYQKILNLSSIEAAQEENSKKWDKYEKQAKTSINFFRINDFDNASYGAFFQAISNLQDIPLDIFFTLIKDNKKLYEKIYEICEIIKAGEEKIEEKLDIFLTQVIQKIQPEEKKTIVKKQSTSIDESKKEANEILSTIESCMLDLHLYEKEIEKFVPQATAFKLKKTIGDLKRYKNRILDKLNTFTTLKQEITSDLATINDFINRSRHQIILSSELTESIKELIKAVKKIPQIEQALKEDESNELTNKIKKIKEILQKFSDKKTQKNDSSFGMLKSYLENNRNIVFIALDDLNTNDLQKLSSEIKASSLKMLKTYTIFSIDKQSETFETYIDKILNIKNENDEENTLSIASIRINLTINANKAKLAGTIEQSKQINDRKVFKDNFITQLLRNQVLINEIKKLDLSQLQTLKKAIILTDLNKFQDILLTVKTMSNDGKEVISYDCKKPIDYIDELIPKKKTDEVLNKAKELIKSSQKNTIKKDKIIEEIENDLGQDSLKTLTALKEILSKSDEDKEVIAIMIDSIKLLVSKQELLQKIIERNDGPDIIANLAITINLHAAKDAHQQVILSLNTIIKDNNKTTQGKQIEELTVDASSSVIKQRLIDLKESSKAKGGFSQELEKKQKALSKSKEEETQEDEEAAEEEKEKEKEEKENFSKLKETLSRLTDDKLAQEVNSLISTQQQGRLVARAMLEDNKIFDRITTALNAIDYAIKPDDLKTIKDEYNLLETLQKLKTNKEQKEKLAKEKAIQEENEKKEAQEIEELKKSLSTLSDDKLAIEVENLLSSTFIQQKRLATIMLSDKKLFEKIKEALKKFKKYDSDNFNKEDNPEKLAKALSNEKISAKLRAQAKEEASAAAASEADDEEWET